MFKEAWDEQYPYSQGGLFPHPPLPSELTNQVNMMAHHMVHAMCKAAWLTPGDMLPTRGAYKGQQAGRRGPSRRGGGEAHNEPPRGEGGLVAHWRATRLSTALLYCSKQKITCKQISKQACSRFDACGFNLWLLATHTVTGTCVGSSSRHMTGTCVCPHNRQTHVHVGLLLETCTKDGCDWRQCPPGRAVVMRAGPVLCLIAHVLQQSRSVVTVMSCHHYLEHVCGAIALGSIVPYYLPHDAMTCPLSPSPLPLPPPLPHGPL